MPFGTAVYREKPPQGTFGTIVYREVVLPPPHTQGTFAAAVYRETAPPFSPQLT